ncbi:GIY-YIG nuclease family protein [Echinicola strongylocentroti]
MYFVYVLYSRKTAKSYIGSCREVGERLRHHNSGLTPSTKGGTPEWEVNYVEKVDILHTTGMERKFCSIFIFSLCRFLFIRVDNNGSSNVSKRRGSSYENWESPSQAFRILFFGMFSKGGEPTGSSCQSTE